MKLNIEITTDDTDGIKKLHDISRALLGISGDVAPAAQANPASPPKAAASTPAPAQAAATTTATAPVSGGAPTTPSASDGATIDLPTVTAAFQAFVKANGPAKMKAILTEFGAANIPAIPAERYGELLARLQQPAA